MSPMSMNTLDAQTLQQIAQHEAAPSPSGERIERWFTQAAMAVIALSVLAVLVI
jgi:hypothetical protein